MLAVLFPECFTLPALQVCTEISVVHRYCGTVASIALWKDVKDRDEKTVQLRKQIVGSFFWCSCAHRYSATSPTWRSPSMMLPLPLSEAERQRL